MQWRYFGSGALIEENCVRSRSLLTTNLRVGRNLTRNSEFTLDALPCRASTRAGISARWKSYTPSSSEGSPEYIH
jgi:hypothetical protein